MISGIALVGISYYKLRNTEKFKVRSEAPELSKQVTGVVEGYEQRVTKNDRLYLLVKASKDTTFSDGHHELENVSMQVYPPEGDVPDQISAARAVYIPETNILSFSGNVRIETKDKLKVGTETLSFDQNSGVAQTDAPVTFERENVSGKSIGAVVEQKAKRLDLKRDVEITVAPRVPSETAAKSPTRARPVLIKAARGVFEQDALKFTFSGGVTFEQERDILSGENLNAFLNQEKRLERAELRGNSYLRSMEPGHAAEVSSVDMDFFLDKDQRLQRALANNVVARSLDADSDMQLSGASSLEVLFQANADSSVLKQMQAGQRSTITLSAPKSKANDPRAANKRITADNVRLAWRSTGRDLEKAEASGNAELFIEPVVNSARAERKTLNAPRFDCEFFDAGNLARECKATGGSKATIDPVQPTPKRGTRVLTSQNMTALFVKDTQDIERVDAQGDGKFNENDRNGVAANVSYVAADQTVRLRGGDPTVWDSRGRTKGDRARFGSRKQCFIWSRPDLDDVLQSGTDQRRYAFFENEKPGVHRERTRRVSSRKRPGNLFRQCARVGRKTTTCAATSWSSTSTTNEWKRRAEVQTTIYNSKRRVENQMTVVPVFASADSMFYSDPDRTIHYEGNVDIKQGTDRLTGGVADIYLAKESNEMQKTVAQQNVVLTQPMRKGTGDWVEYTAADEIAVLKGNPARVEDVQEGNTQGSRLTVSLRDSKVTADDARGPLSPGRVRSTHKIRKP